MKSYKNLHRASSFLTIALGSLVALSLFAPSALAGPGPTPAPEGGIIGQWPYSSEILRALPSWLTSQLTTEQLGEATGFVDDYLAPADAAWLLGEVRALTPGFWNQYRATLEYQLSVVEQSITIHPEHSSLLVA